MIYENNDQIIREIKAAAAREGTTLTAIAEKLGMLQATLSGVLHKKQLSFADVSRIAGAIGYQLEFQLIPSPALFQDGPNDQTGKPGKQSSK